MTSQIGPYSGEELRETQKILLKYFEVTPPLSRLGSFESYIQKIWIRERAKVVSYLKESGDNYK